MYAFKLFTFVRHDPVGEDRPLARSGHRIVCDEKYLYSYGGYNPSIPESDPSLARDAIWNATRPLFKELWKFNLSSQRWKLLPGRQYLPKELASTAVFLRFGKLIIYGGTGEPFGESCNNLLYSCDLKNGSIMALNVRGTLPDPQYGQALICHGSYLYTVGGTTGFDYSCDVHRIDLTTGIWETVYICSGSDPLEPAGRYRHELAYDGKYMYILGGGTSASSFGFTEIPAFDLENNKWLLLPTHGDEHNDTWMPGPRRCHGAVQYTDSNGDVNVVISGGLTDPHVYNDVWRLNLRLLQWTCLGRFNAVLPRPVYFHSAALAPNGRMYIFGGILYNSSAGMRTFDVHSVWLIIPKLTEIAWDALKFYTKNWKNKSRDDLIKIGIPMKFIETLEFDD